MRVCVFVKVRVGNWGLAHGWMRFRRGGRVCEGWSLLSNDEKVLLLTFVIMKASTLDLSSELITADVGDMSFFIDITSCIVV